MIAEATASVVDWVKDLGGFGALVLVLIWFMRRGDALINLLTVTLGKHTKQMGEHTQSIQQLTSKVEETDKSNRDSIEEMVRQNQEQTLYLKQLANGGKIE